jgi:two-component system LytT family response regulator
MKAYLIDDEPLAVTRLRRLLEADGRVEVVGANSDPRRALEDLFLSLPDVLFLDIEMPGMSGFDLLEQLGARHPLVIFTTAYDRYALDAFKVNSIDYLLKPVESEQLARAISKLERIIQLERIGGGAMARGNIDALLKQVRAMIQHEPERLTRVASRTGDRVEFIEVSAVSHFYAEDKLTFAATASKDYAVDLSIAELEQRLPPSRWVRIHRSTLLNVDAVKELRTWFSGKLLVKLKDGKTELQVARERVASVKGKLGL